MGIFSNKLAKIIEHANERIKTDSQARSVMQNYNGRSIMLEVDNEENYVVSISSQGLSLIEPSSGFQKDLWVRMDKEVLKKALKGDFNTFWGKAEAVLFLASGRIKHNLSINDWNNVKGFIGF